MLAATPAWFSDNLTAIAVGTLLVLTLLVLRLIQKVVVRFALLALIGAAAIFVYVNRDALEDCARTCECRLLDRDIEVGACDADLPLG